jgi:hypothetical protein
MKYLFLFLFLVSCSTEYKIARLCKKRPDICRVDTVHIEGKTIEIFMELPVDTIAIDSVSLQISDSVAHILALNSYSIDSLKKILRTRISQIIEKKAHTLISWPKDTIRGEEKGVSFSIWVKNGKLYNKVEVPPKQVVVQGMPIYKERILWKPIIILIIVITLLIIIIYFKFK